MNGNSWLGPAVVLCQQGQSVWIHTNGDIKKVVAYKVKPFQLVDRESIKDVSKEGDAVSKKVMLEDGLKDVENLFDPEDLGGDTVGAKYLKMASTISFSDMCAYVVELSVSEHWKAGSQGSQEE